MADAHCASYDRIAVYQRSSLGEGMAGFLTGLPVIAKFECRAPIKLLGIQVRPPELTKPVTAVSPKLPEPSKQVTAVSPKLPEPSKQVTAVSPKSPEQPVFAIHLSSLRNKLGIETEWQQLRAKFPDLLADRELIVRSVELPGKGTFYRVLTGRFGDYAKAQEFCARFKSKGHYCLARRLQEDRPE